MHWLTVSPLVGKNVVLQDYTGTEWYGECIAATAAEDYIRVVVPTGIVLQTNNWESVAPLHYGQVAHCNHCTQGGCGGGNE